MLASSCERNLKERHASDPLVEILCRCIAARQPLPQVVIALVIIER